ncbi:MAG: hypothetical protein Q8P22_05640 [Chloroflexota bacterium]|nr:hypothetical protein [Chloroflexota bacterium]
MEYDQRQAARGAETAKVTLVAKIDQRAIPGLDTVAKANMVSTAHLMSQFLDDVGGAVQLLENSEGTSFDTVRDWFAMLIVQRCSGATPETLKAVGRIWARAAELKAQEGGDQR